MGGRKPKDTTPPGPTLTLVLYKKTPARKNSLELKVAQLKGEGTVALHRRTEVCVCGVCGGDNRKIDSTIPWVGGGGRKEAAVPLGLRRREDRSLCVEDWSPSRGALMAQWGEEAGPHHQDHQERRASVIS